MPNHILSEGDSKLEICLFDTLPSTQTYLAGKIRSGELSAPIAVIADDQSDGVGSRGNTWSGGRGNLFVSIALDTEMLPIDLPLSSASIYFAFIMRKILTAYNGNIWLKWPNDLYIKNDKVGGVITQKISEQIVCGIGINLKNYQNGYKVLGSDILPLKLLENYLFELEKFPSWKQIFREYQIEFELSRRFFVNIENYQQSLKNAVLSEDGSIIINGKRVFNLR